MANNKKKIIQALRKAYSMEVETIVNYLANSIHLDGVRAEAIKQALAEDIQEELGHANSIGNRLKQLGDTVPGSLNVDFNQKAIQPPKDTTDVVKVIKGVIDAEEDAITHYKQIIKMTDGEDYVTQDLAIQILSAEEAHRQQFEGYLKEYSKLNS